MLRLPRVNAPRTSGVRLGSAAPKTRMKTRLSRSAAAPYALYHGSAEDAEREKVADADGGVEHVEAEPDGGVERVPLEAVGELAG